MITIHLSDGGNITNDKDKICFFNSNDPADFPEIMGDVIVVNLAHVVDMRPAEDYEIARCKNRGY